MVGYTWRCHPLFILLQTWNGKWQNYLKKYFHNYISRLISQGYHGRRWQLILSPESACFRTGAHLWKTFELHSGWWSGFPSNINLCVPIFKIHANNTMRSAILMIYKHVYNHPFKNFVNRKYEGVEDLVCGNVGKTDWFRRFLMWARFDGEFMK